MARTIQIPRSHLIMALCLPLAVVLGYFLAEPLASGSMGVVVFVLTILAVPIMMKWYHPLLVFSWNSGVVAFLLPGQPQLWMCIAFTGFVFALLNRSVSQEHQFNLVPALTKPILFLLGVVLLTSFLTGGFGIRSLGGARFGGKAYFYIFSAIAGYFAFASRRIPPERAKLFVGIFFLSGLLSLIPAFANRVGLDLGPLGLLFPGSDDGQEVLGANYNLFPAIRRPAALFVASPALYFFLLVRYGIRGVLDFKKIWRPILFGLSILGCLACGFRSLLILFVLTFGVLFYLEGLHKTKLLPAIGAVMILCIGGLIVFSSKLPLTVQRTLSFLPIKVDYVVERDSHDSTIWRLQIWKEVMPDIPRYFFKGKGFTMNEDDMYWIQNSYYFKMPQNHEGSIASNDYHSGPLSVIIPFGIFGVIGFLWLLGAGIRYLYQNIRYGDPEFKTANTAILAIFVAHIVQFLLVFGSFYSDLWAFTGLLGLSVSLNGKRESETAPATEPAFTPFSSIADGKNSA